MKSKKGQVEQSFHWLFVIIAGAVILLLFGVFIFTFKESAERENTADMLNDLRLLLTGSEISSNTVNTIENLPNAEMLFSCRDVAVDESQIFFQEKAVFAPPSIDSSRLFLWSYDWNVPFHVMNLLLVSSPKQRYVFVYDPLHSELYNELREMIPDVFVTDAVTQISRIRDEGQERTRLIFIDKEPSQNDVPLKGFSNLEVIQITSQGEVKYYTLSNGKLRCTGCESSYIGKAGMLAALFASDKEQYECGMDIAFRRFALVAQVYQHRLNLLSAIPGDCGQFSTADLEFLADEASGGFANADLPRMRRSMANLDQDNKFLQLRSCPLMY